MNTKVIASVCAGIALVGSIIAVNSWLELRKQREVNAAWRESHIEVPLPANLPAAPPPDTTVATPTPPPPPETPISRTESSASSPAKNDPSDQRVARAERQNERMKDPEYRKRLRVTVLTNLKQSHPDLAQELGLSQDEAERLLELLADDDFARRDDGYLQGGPDVDVPEAVRKQQEFDRQLEESIRAQLGDKYPQWQAYQQTRPTRVQVVSVSRRLASAGMPLSSEQTKTLKTAWIAERQRQAEDEKVGPQDPSGNPRDPAQELEEFSKRKEETIRRVLEVSAPYFDATQLAEIRKEMQKVSLHEAELRLLAARSQQESAQ